MLEAKIVELTQAVNRLTEALSAGGAVPVATGGTAASSPATVVTETAAPATSGDAVPYEKVRDAVVSLSSTKGRDAAVGVLTSLGVKTAKELKPEQYPAALDALTKAAA